MTYTIRLPAAPLDRLVDHLWAFEDHPVPALRGTLFADGRPDLMFNLGRPIWLVSPGSRTRWSGAWVSGPRFAPLTIELEHDRIDILGVRFRATGIAAVLGVPAQEVSASVVELREFWRRRGGAVVDALFAQRGAAARLQLLERELVRHVVTRRLPPDPLGAAAEQLLSGVGDSSIEAIRGRLGVSHKHLTRLFRTHAGMTPKLLQRVGRFRRLLTATGAAGGKVDWPRLALEAGYFDQAHMIGEFREFTGMTPTAYAPPPFPMPDYMPWSPPVC